MQAHNMKTEAGETVIKAYPAAAGLAADRPLPTGEDRQSLERNAPLTFLFCTSRSGVILLHALLDGHPELVQVPTYLKAFDFFAAHPTLWCMEAPEAARTFADYGRHDVLFDTGLSAWHRGRLGPDMKTVVTVDKNAFIAALTSTLPKSGFSAREFIYAVILAYAWCLGQPYQQARAVLLHIHHGDWLWPDAEIEKSALDPIPTERGIDLMRPDKVLVTVRDPVETIASCKKLVAQYKLSPNDEALYRERYLRLLIQDWHRHERIRLDSLPLKIVPLEQIRRQTRETMADAAEWLGLSPNWGPLEDPTLYGEIWWGDSFTEPSDRPKAPRPPSPPRLADPDHVFFFTGAGDYATASGYSAPSGWGLGLVRMLARGCHAIRQGSLTAERRNFLRKLGAAAPARR